VRSEWSNETADLNNNLSLKYLESGSCVSPMHPQGHVHLQQSNLVDVVQDKTVKGENHCEIMIEPYLECQCQSQDLSKKCDKMMKMSCQYVVPKCAKVTTDNNTKHRLPYLKILFQGFMVLRIFNYGHRG
jgi:hypothetical protein